MTQLKPFDDLYAVPIPKGAKITEVKQMEQSTILIIETAPKKISIQPIKGNWQLLFTTESGHSLMPANWLEGNYAIVKK